MFERWRGAKIQAETLVVFNAGNNRRLDFRELSAEVFENFWRIAGFLVGREAARRLAPLGTAIFTGASASLRRFLPRARRPCKTRAWPVQIQGAG